MSLFVPREDDDKFGEHRGCDSREYLREDGVTVVVFQDVRCGWPTFNS